MIANASKSCDLVLRVTPIFQVIEMSIEFLEEHSNFAFASRMDSAQLLLLAANIMKPMRINAAINIVEAF